MHTLISRRKAHLSMKPRTKKHPLIGANRAFQSRNRSSPMCHVLVRTRYHMTPRGLPSATMQSLGNLSAKACDRSSFLIPRQMSRDCMLIRTQTMKAQNFAQATSKGILRKRRQWSLTIVSILESQQTKNIEDLDTFVPVAILNLIRIK